jgi:SAM-dependent methyltransferase
MWHRRRGRTSCSCGQRATVPEDVWQFWRAIMRLVTSSPPDPLDFRSVRDAYDRVAEDYATYLPDTRAEAQLDLAVIDAFAEGVTSGDDARVLDAGCGAGRMSRYLAERGCAVEGVDLSSRMVARARRDHGDLVFTVVADGFQSGDGTRDVSGAYRQFGHEIQLERHLYTAVQVASQLQAAGFREVCRLVRRAQGQEKDDQAVLLAKAD